jgi:class 3 adenylate cyclase
LEIFGGPERSAAAGPHGATMDVASWLSALGLGQYEPAFRENGIDAELLPKLTAEDLRDLGVVRVGDRRRLLDAVAGLRDGAGPTLLGAQPLTPNLEARWDAERRQLTILFCDLVGSSDLAARLDPEDFRDVISTYQRKVDEAMVPFGGFVAKYMGDGVLIYFGYPRATEHDAERAVRAGLGLVDAIAAIESPKPSLSVRVGIATGLVVVGDSLGSGPSQEQAVVGETPNLGARLQGLAEPNSVLICPTTRRLVGDLFACRDLGPVSLKGFPTSVRVTQALGESALPGRFEALRATSLTPLVGREEQIELLHRRWESAKAGAGQVVLISGEPGVGKSRITHALDERLRGERLTRLRYFCSPHHVDTALYPFINQLEQAAGIGRDDTPIDRIEKVKTRLAGGAASDEDLDLFAALAVPSTVDGQTSSAAGSRSKRAKTFAAFIRQIVTLSERGPVLMVFEDAHWSDPTSVELLNMIVGDIRAHSVLLILTFRPEFRLQWAGDAHVTTLVLNRLDARHTAEFAQRVAGGKALPSEIVGQIVQRTDGVPLFIEELTRTILESGVLKEDGHRYLLEGSLPAGAIPSSLQASLLARLDRLAPARRLAQIGAAFGREFPHRLLSVVAEYAEADLVESVTKLIEAGLISRRGVPPDATYVFKHALVQDAAYGTLLRGTRRALHAKIAAALEQHFADLVQNRPELLAHHHSEAKAPAIAAKYWLEAGRNNARRSAHVEAIRSYESALAAIRELPDDPISRRMELDVQLALTPSSMSVGMADERTRAAAQRAICLCEEFGTTRRAIPARFALASYLSSSGDLVSAMAEARRTICIGEDLGDDAILLLGHRSVGSGALWLGDLDAARRHLETALSIATRMDAGEMSTLGDFDHHAAAVGLYGHLQLRRGDLYSGWRFHDEASRMAKTRDDAFTVAFILLHRLISEVTTSSFESLQSTARTFVDVCEKRDIQQWRDTGELIALWCAVKTGREEAVPDELPARVARLRKAPWQLQFPFCLRLGAEMLILADGFFEARELLDELDQLVDTTKQIWILPDAYRLRAELDRRAAAGSSAEWWLEKSLAQARDHGETYAELCAARDLARLFMARGEPGRAGELLTVTCEKINGSTDNLDLREARALLRDADI